METKPTFKVIIAGGREFRDYALLCESCDKFLCQEHQTYDIVVISGTARGADTLGERYAHERGYAVEKYPADWNRDGKAAGPIRNAQMAKVADTLIAFWDGQSKGTANMIDQAKTRGLSIKIVKYK